MNRRVWRWVEGGSGDCLPLLRSKGALSSSCNAGLSITSVMARSRLQPKEESLTQSGAVPSLSDEAKSELDGLVQVKELERHPKWTQAGSYVALHLKLAIVDRRRPRLGWVLPWLSIPWIETLGESITIPLAIAVIFGIAIIPCVNLNANLITSLLIDRPPPLRFDLEFPALTVVIACFNEEKTITETLDYLREAEISRRTEDRRCR